MKVKVVAPFPLAGQDADSCIDLPEGARVSALIALKKGAPIYGRLLPVSVNGVQVRKSHKLHNGDLVIFILPIAGG